MNKILLIIQREYLTRVKKKSFIVMTFLVPGLIIGMYAVMGYLIVNNDEFADKKKVIVVDETGNFRNKLKNTTSTEYNYSSKSFAEVKSNFSKYGDDYLLYIPADKTDVLLLSKKKPGLETTGRIERQLNNLNRTQLLLDAGIDTAIVNSKAGNIDVNARQLTDEGEKDAGAWLAYAIGFLSAMLIYMSLLIYGIQVMRGVIEEKTNRIIEVVISSVKPFQLMLGKIIGVGMVGMTQFLLWILLSASLATGAGLLFVKGSDVKKFQNQQNERTIAAGGTSQQASQAEASKGEKIMESLGSVAWTYTVSVFLFYFLFGFMFYSSIFAAVGSAVDNETDSQQFMLPITVPLIFTFILSMSFVINNPDSPLSFWLSIIPFSSPIAMMIRIPFGVPAWELALSMFLMVAGFLAMTWVAARIYRVGILMYGKKVSLKELAKWLSYKE